MHLTRNLCALAITLLAIPAFAQTEGEATEAAPAVVAAPVTASASLTLTLESTGSIERNVSIYQCDTGETLSVQYINAAPNFLAIVPVNGQSYIFATTISGSGVRYISGPYEWWSHQGEATLRDLMQEEDAQPLATCTETSNTP